MSQTVVAETAAATAACAIPLLGLAGVAAAAVWAAGRAATLLCDRPVDRHEAIAAESLTDRYLKEARAARDRFLAELSPRPGNRREEAESARRAAETLARAAALREAFRATPALALVAEAHRRPQIREALGRLDEARAAFGARAYSRSAARAGEVEATLAEAARAAALRLGQAQQELVAQRLRAALPALGYRLHEAAAAGLVAFRATAEEHVLAVVVTAEGKLLVEAAGFAGGACRPAIAALFQRLRDEGIAVEAVATSAHGRWEGGVILGQAGPSPLDILQAAERLRGRGADGRGRHARRDAREHAWRGRQATAWAWGARTNVRG